MKFLKITVLLSLTFFLQSARIDQNTCDIEVVVTGLENNTGQLMLSIHLGPEGFPEDNMYRELIITDFSSPTYTVVLKDIPYGEGAISLLHDENSSGKMDFNFVHYPTEGFAFYKFYKVVLSRPSYEDVSFKITEPKMRVELKMQY